MWLIVLPLIFELSPPVVLREILAVIGGTKPYYFWKFQLSPLVVLLEILVAKGGTMWARKRPMNFAWNARLPRSTQGSFTCRKSTTWDRRLYFPSEGRRAEEFFALKNPTALAGFEPATLGSRGQHATSRPPKPQYVYLHLLCFCIVLFMYIYSFYDFV
jgi:hypothetical protein